MHNTKLKLSDKLPLTCSRAGTCCHGNKVTLNPWELFTLAKGKQITTSKFKALYTIEGGIQLNFNGKKGYQNKHACSQYIENFGCSLHESRPLACRLYPLGRQIQNNHVEYIHEGSTFPCSISCPEVAELPYLTVETYLTGQGIEPFGQAQDAYLEVMENLADMAFELLLETDLAQSGDKTTLKMWRKMGNESSNELIKRLGKDWIDLLLTPPISRNTLDSNSFVNKHFELMQKSIHEKIMTLSTLQSIHEASVLLMGLALFLGKSNGANPEELANHWADTALSLGALE